MTSGNADRDRAPIDVDDLSRKYAEERARRQRPDGKGQYIAIDGEFGRYTGDPYVDEPITRDPIAEDLDVLILGGGMCGLLIGSRLRQAGIDNIKIIERASDFGGTWYWNRYPGIGCDTESYIYLPLLEETGYMPTEKYAKGPEILNHFRRIGKLFGLYENACFQTKLEEMRWDEGLDRWIVSTDRGDVFKARYVCVCTGTQNRPKLPGIPGILDFNGHSFHTSRWDYGYTGGDGTGNLDRLRDKRVAVIGTGATAIQSVPHLARSADHLYVFQRTPSSVDVRGNRPTDEAWAAALEPGWQRQRMLNFEALTLGIPQDEDLVSDGWTHNAQRLRAVTGGTTPAEFEALRQRADFERMEEIRRRVDDIVKDPVTAQALKPYYNLYCKRPCFHDEYLQAFNRSNVSLVDTKGQGVERITEDAVVVDGRAYKVDCIIYSTGFEVLAKPWRAGECKIFGAGGMSLEEKWGNGPIKSLHGVFTRGFPNMMVVGALRDSGASSNAHFAYNGQCLHVAEVISRCLSKGVTHIEPTEAAELGWHNTMREKAPPMDKFWAECTPGYLNNEGAGGGDGFRMVLYGGGSIEYFDILEDWRSKHLERDLGVRS
jgi:cation diffusion facilitator CzcD-associated flavoprotein CzcO